MAVRAKIQAFLLPLLLSIDAYSAVYAESVIRGPYLQQGHDDGIHILWRTDSPSPSEIIYGKSPAQLSSAVTIPDPTVNHEVTLSGLDPDAQYYYAIVGDSGAVIAGGDASHFFRTSPPPGTAKATRVWVLGDSGTADGNARAVRDAYKAFNGSRYTDLLLMLGDNAYTSGTDSEYQRAVFDMYPDVLKQTPLWPTLGNHDARSADSPTQSGVYYNVFSLPKKGEAGGLASGTEAYYSFDYGNIHFICLDSMDTSRSKTGAMMTWLKNDLAANDRDWTIAFWHHPPYSKGSHNSDSETNLIQMRENALPILESYGVDLVLAGHSHSYERSFLLDGHYGASSTLDTTMILDAGDGREDGDGAYVKAGIGPVAHEGAVYAVAGTSGKVTDAALDHPVMVVSLLRLGSMVLDVDGNRLDAKFIDDKGNIQDHFTMEKNGDGTPPPLAASMHVGDIGLTLKDAGAEKVVGATVHVIDANSASVANATVTGDWSGLVGGTQSGVTDAKGNVELVSPGFEPNAQGDITFTVSSVSAAGYQYDAAANAETTDCITTTGSPCGTGGGDGSTEFQDGASPDASYAGTADTYLYEGAPDTNFSTDTIVKVDGAVSGGTDRIALLRWDVGSLPAGAQIVSAEIEVNVTNVSRDSYGLYEVKRDWREGEATWNQYAAGQPWQAPGAGGSNDRGSSALAVARLTQTGRQIIPLNGEGVALIQNWVNGVTPNRGVLLGDTAATDGLSFASSEATQISGRPILRLTYRVAGANTAPTVTITAPKDGDSFSAGDNVQFSGSATDGEDGDAAVTASLAWSSSIDGALGTGDSVALSTLSAGVHTITATATDSGGLTGSATVTITIGGSGTVEFQNGGAPDSAYAGMTDTFIDEAEPNQNYGDSAILRVDGNSKGGGGSDQTTLIRWDIADLPPGAVIESAEIDIDVDNRSGDAFEIYEMKRDWRETEATWNRFATGQPWEEPGAAGPADRGSDVLGVVLAPRTGPATISLNASGIALIQSWADGIKPNRGLILSNSASTDGLHVGSSEASTISSRPRLRLTYSLSGAGG